MKKAIILSEKEFNSIPFLLQPKILEFWDNLLKEDPNFNPYKIEGREEILLTHLCLSFFTIEKEMEKNNLFSLEKEAEEILKQKAIWYDLHKEVEEIKNCAMDISPGLSTIIRNLQKKQNDTRNKIDKIEEEAIERIGAKIKKIKMLKANMKTMNKLTQNKEEDLK